MKKSTNEILEMLELKDRNAQILDLYPEIIEDLCHDLNITRSFVKNHCGPVIRSIGNRSDIVEAWKEWKELASKLNIITEDHRG